MKNLKAFISIVMCVILTMAVTYTDIRSIKNNDLMAKTAAVPGEGNQALGQTASGGKEFEKTVEGLKFEIKLDKEKYTINDKIKINTPRRQKVFMVKMVTV